RSSAGAPWQAAGPTNVGGRITAIAVDPNDDARIWIGGADGGVFTSSDTGVTWTPQLDGFGGLSIGALAYHPSDPDILLAGTGEANASGDSYDGIGLLKTTDGGATWSVTGLANAQRIGRIAWNPVDTDVIHVAVSGGLFSKGPHRGMYRSTDSGSTWAQTLFVSDSTSAIDVAVDPVTPDNVYAAFWERLRGPDNRSVAGPTSGIWKSTDGGDSWSLLTNGLPSGSQTGRIGLAVAASSPQTVYAIYADTPGSFDGVYKTTNGGASWSRIDDGNDLNGAYSSFGWYFGNIRVDPTNANTVWTVGLNAYRSTDGGVNWTNMTSGNRTHVDHHDLWIDPSNPSRIYDGNDGGFYVSTNGGSVWAHRNTLPITQFYAVTVDPQVPARIYGGTQDNSTPRTLTGALDDWDVLIGGDGFTAIVDFTDSDVMYGEYQFGGLSKTTNATSAFPSFSLVKSGISGSDRTNWHAPVVMDPNNHLVLYFGTNKCYKTTNGAGSWTAISGDLTDGPGGGSLTFGTLTTIAVSATAPNTIYTGSDDGNVYVTTNGGGNWTEIDAGLPVRWVTRVAVDPADDAVAYVTFSGYKEDEFLPHVFRTTNHGASWTDISGNLPDTPVNDIVPDPADAGRLFLATDVGVFVTNDLGGSWELLGAGLPLSVVVDLELHDGTRTLVAGTHGRSAWTLDLQDAVDAPAVAGAPAAVSGPQLAAPAPNPARGAVALAFTLPAAGNAKLTVHDVAGRRIATVWDGAAPAGRTQARWDGRDESGAPVAAGAYFARLEAGGEVRTEKIVRVR
ncbi:MAG TPA: FlgD immunoglobulin-like domain containing protein, partial [bacterium]|nr:FlgD immunoglobulin-like domain containing protein [bacterium]